MNTLGMTREQALAAAITAYALPVLRNEYQYRLEEESCQNTIDAYLRAVDWLEYAEEITPALKRRLLRIGLAIGQYKRISEQDYHNVQVMGADKRTLYPKLDGHRLSLALRDDLLIEGAKDIIVSRW